MAFSLGDAVVFLKTDDSQLSTGVDTAKTKVGSFVGGATQLLGGVLVGAAAAAGAAIVGIGTAAFNVSQDTATAAADISASLGIPIEKAEEFADVARKVFGNNFAESVGEASAAVTEIAKQLGVAAEDPALQTITENAFRLKDTFGVDVTESVSAVKSLMENFGISSNEAFDLLAAGYQRGLDRSGDFLDTIGEYSVQFAEGGATATEFFSALDTGLQGGMLGTDKAADAFKEFRLRIQDGSKLTADSLAALGLNADAITEDLANGTLTVKDVFDQVQAAMWATEDPIVRFNAGVGLLGSQFEDLGEKTILAMDLTDDWAEGTQGAIGTLDTKYKTFGSAVEGIWRRLVVSISPFTDKLLELVNDAMPTVMKAFDALDAAVGPTMEGIGDVINTTVDLVNGLFSKFKVSVDKDGTGTIQFFKEWVDKTFPLVQKLIENVLNGIQVFWDDWGDEIMGIVNFIFGSVWTMIDTSIRNVADTITLVLQLLTGDWEGAWNTFKRIAERIWNAISGIIGNAISGIRNAFTSVDWGSIGSALIDGIVNGINGAWTRLTDAAGNAAKGALDAAKSMLGISSPSKRAAAEIGLPFLQGIGAGIEAGMPGLMSKMQMQIDGMMAGLSGNVGATSTINNNIMLNMQGSGYAPSDALSAVQLLNMHYRRA